MKFFKIDTSDSNTSEETVYYTEIIAPVKIISFSDTHLLREESPDSTDNNNLPSARRISEINSKFIDTGSTVETSINSDPINSSSENLILSTVTVQNPPQSPIPVAPAITPAINRIPIHDPDLSEVDALPFPLPPLQLTQTS